jgi:hypothetical protein
MIPRVKKPGYVSPISIAKGDYPDYIYEWRADLRSDVALSDVVRFILIVQLRRELGLEDDESFIEPFFDRAEYRHRGVMFLEELDHTSIIISEWCKKYLEMPTGSIYLLDTIDVHKNLLR